MRAPNFYAHPGFERAGLRRRDSGWIRDRIADPASLFVPVWRNQNLVIELDGAEPRAVVLAAAAVAASHNPAEERLARGEVVFLGVVEERAHFALDLSPLEAPLDTLRSPAMAASGIGAGVRFTDLRQLGGRIERRDRQRHRFFPASGLIVTLGSPAADRPLANPVRSGRKQP